MLEAGLLRLPHSSLAGLGTCPPKTCGAMTGQSSLSQQGSCRSGLSHGIRLSMLCCPPSGFPVSQEELSQF